MIYKFPLAVILIVFCCSLNIPSFVGLSFNNSGGELVLFTQPGDLISEQEKIKISTLAKDFDINYREVNITEAAPAEVVLTPTIMFQNYRGRSFFKGRYKNLPRLKNFIRISRTVHQQNSKYSKDYILLQTKGRANIAAQMKITPLTGNIPANFDQNKFNQEARSFVSSNLQYFSPESNIHLPSNTRFFYFSLYPYLDDRNNFSLSMELYSQFNCIEPIFIEIQDPVRAKWKKYSQTFSEAGKIIEQEILNQIATSNKGDAFQILLDQVKEIAWKELDLEISAPSIDSSLNIGYLPKVELNQNWIFDSPINSEVPVVLFHFQAPVDNYSGEATEMNGTLEFSPDSKSMSGTFEVETGTVTMGDIGLDGEIKGNMLEVEKYPKASFSFKDVPIKIQNELSPVLPFEVSGEFEMLGFKFPVTVNGTFETLVSDNSEIRLMVSGQFELNIKQPFNLKGPDGPQPEAETLVFYLNFLMKAF